MHRLSSMIEGSLHPDILGATQGGTISDAHPGCCDWAVGVQEQYASLGMTLL